jgi:hypothetical protein
MRKATGSRRFLVAPRLAASPTAPTWLKELVQAVTRLYELDVDVLQSDLQQRPRF